MAQLRKNITHTYHHCLPAFSQTNMLPFSSYYSANSVSMCTDSILPKQSQSSYSFLQRPLMILFQQWDGWIGRIPDYSSHVMVEYCLCTPRKGTACKSECKTPVRVNLRWFFSPGGSDYSISTWKSTHQYLRWGNCPVISIREENLSHTMWYWGEKAQAEEVGGKGYLILHYFFLILGLKGSPPHKITLKCMKSQILFLSLLGMCPVTHQAHPQCHRVRRWWRHMVKGELFQAIECVQLQTAWIQPQAHLCCVCILMLCRTWAKV